MLHLTAIDELNIQPWDMYHRVKGLALVDHNVPRKIWTNATILSILDHHVDMGTAPTSSPRIITTSASCSSSVAKYVLDELDQRQLVEPVVEPLPVELVDLLLRTIAIDSDGLSNKDAFEVDVESAKRLLEISTWKGKDLKETMGSLGSVLQEKKDDLGNLTVRDLLRRDWKGDECVSGP